MLAAVGPMQFEVAAHRLGEEFGAPVTLEGLDYQVARRTSAEHVDALGGQRGVEVLERSDGAMLALFANVWRLRSVQIDHPDLMLEPLLAGQITSE